MTAIKISTYTLLSLGLAKTSHTFVKQTVTKYKTNKRLATILAKKLGIEKIDKTKHLLIKLVQELVAFVFHTYL